MYDNLPDQSVHDYDSNLDEHPKYQYYKWNKYDLVKGMQLSKWYDEDENQSEYKSDSGSYAEDAETRFICKKYYFF